MSPLPVEALDYLQLEAENRGIGGFLFFSADPHGQVSKRVGLLLTQFKGATPMIFIPRKSYSSPNILLTDSRYFPMAKSFLQEEKREGQGKWDVILWEDLGKSLKNIKDLTIEKSGKNQGESIILDGNLSSVPQLLALKKCEFSEIIVEDVESTLESKAFILPSPKNPIWDFQKASETNSVLQSAIAALVTNPHSPDRKIKSRAEKLSSTLASMESSNNEVLYLNSGEEIAYLFNTRGSDYECVPASRTFALIKKSEKKATVTLYLELSAAFENLASTFTEEFKHVANFDVDFKVKAYDEITTDLAKVAQLKLTPTQISVSKNICVLHAQLLGLDLQTASLKKLPFTMGLSPVKLMKARKSPAEIAAFRIAHIHDGLAKSRFLHWLSTQSFPKKNSGYDSAAVRNEWNLCEVLKEFRMGTSSDFHDLSFQTIMGSGSNGSYVHYKPTAEKSSVVHGDDILLIDSGAHYKCGATTDVTRTVWVNANPETPSNPPKVIKYLCTQVLKGYLSLMSAQVKSGANYSAIDCLARSHLWECGLAYGHSTGHGVGAMLNVHEDPPSSQAGELALQTGNVMSIEPGVYISPQTPGGFGMGCRVESLVHIIPAKAHPSFEVKQTEEEFENNPPYLTFQPLTCIPIDKNLINMDAMTPELIEEFDAYHEWVKAELTDAALGGHPSLPLDMAALKTWPYEARQEFVAWLHEATSPISSHFLKRKCIPNSMFC